MGKNKQFLKGEPDALKSQKFNRVNLNLRNKVDEHEIKSIIQKEEIVKRLPLLENSGRHSTFKMPKAGASNMHKKKAESETLRERIPQGNLGKETTENNSQLTHDQLVKHVKDAIGDTASNAPSTSLGGTLNASLRKRYSVSTANRYESLTDDEMDVVSDDDRESVSSKVSRVPKSPPRPPPIVLHGVLENSKSLLDKIKTTTCTDEFHLKYSRDRTSIFFYHLRHYNTFLKSIGEDVEYHTYTPKGERTTAYVIYNLNTDYNEEEITEDLNKKYDLKIAKILKLKNTKSPIYMALLKEKMPLSQLNRQCNLIAHTKIKWDKYNNKRDIIQCKRCQEWGHATSNCHARPRCVKCTKPHHTHECEQTNRDEVRCCNCNGHHPANSETCPVYLKTASAMKRTTQDIRNVTGRRQPQQPIYVPAPPPKTNVWARPSQSTETQHSEYPPLKSTATAPIEIRQQDIDSTNDLTDLMEEFKTLDKLTDVKFMLNAVRELNNRLKSATSKFTQFQIFYEFSKTLDG